MMTQLSLEKDIVKVVRSCRLSYFGHLARMCRSRYPHILQYVVTLKVVAWEADQGKDGWTTWQKTVKCSTCHFLMPAGLHITDNNGDQLSGIAKLDLPESADLSTSPWH